tara:strand:- start:20423 stop:20770 length:348 start_codon:yes stop_codon:yes gene_type:complete
MNTKKARQKLAEALKELPGEFGLSTTRQHMVNALKSITKYEEKRGKKKGEQIDMHQQYWGEIESRAVNQPMSEVSPVAVMRTLQFLDNMIDAENLKIEELNKPVEEETGQGLLKD